MTPTVAIALPPEALEAIAQRVAEILEGRQPAAPTASPYLTITQAAAYIGAKDRQRIDDLLSQRKLTRLKDGRRTLVSRAELESYLVGRCLPVAPGDLSPLGKRARRVRQ